MVIVNKSLGCLTTVVLQLGTNSSMGGLSGHGIPRTFWAVEGTSFYLVAPWCIRWQTFSLCPKMFHRLQLLSSHTFYQGKVEAYSRHLFWLSQVPCVQFFAEASHLSKPLFAGAPWRAATSPDLGCWAGDFWEQDRLIDDTRKPQQPIEWPEYTGYLLGTPKHG